MTPKDKADELIEKFSKLEREDYWMNTSPKQCALIAVEEIIKNYGTVITYYGLSHDKHYWKDVKKEIEKI